ncbi:MAG: bifunctional diguanylate cyclase/phosphodiesterase [Thermomicrobiales bacterium]|nr:bifunctional diguanylate cyclase/phosphodiesterase [Thermomicrobiales bacterium]
MRFARVLDRVRFKFMAPAPAPGDPVDPAIDSLTGLLTHAGLLSAGGTGMPAFGALILFDLDHFRKINTALDFAGGDQVLIEVARRIERHAPAGALAARTGVDEFAILLPATIDGRSFATKLAREIARPIEAGDEQIVVSISIGVAESEPAEGLDTLLRRAGSAMYHHRESEPVRDADTLGTGSANGIRQQFALERELRDGLATGQLRLYYQPIVDLNTHIADECEALLRWDHPERGTLQPGDFLFGIASDRLLRDIGRWVLHDACTQGRAWQCQRPGHPLTMAVNLSSSQIRDPRFVDDVRATLRETGFEPGRLRFEISESITLAELESAVGLIDELRGLGVRMALDDFGAGNAGWTLLRQAHIDAIKLDRSFVAAGPDNLRIVEALTGFARRLGLDVAIEGVERAEQADAMRSVGVHKAQGYYFAAPQPPGEVGALLGSAPLRPVC